MSAAGYVKAFELLLSVTDKLLDKTPNYDQKKREKYHELKRKYQDEKARLGTPSGDHDLLLGLRNDLLLHVETFSQELSEQG